ncbi:MAG: LysE family transporter [Gammaproteobacteria bacterium]|nr:LysE family transporter [Gammaproteobacteria bacterium]
MQASIASAVLLGASGGLSPGPLLMLLIAETLRHGLRAGLMVSIAPLLSDMPIVILSFIVLAQLADMRLVMGGISFAGALLLFYLGLGNLHYREMPERPQATPGRSLRKAVMINFLNPNPYLFWLLLGAPTVIDAWQRSVGEALTFICLFYVLLVGSKMLTALAVFRSRALLQGRAYLWTVRGLGALLVAYAATFAYDGALAFGWI